MSEYIKEFFSSMVTSKDPDFYIFDVGSYELFGKTFYITNVHVCVLIVMLLLIIFSIIANRIIKKAIATETPGKLQNVIELIVEMLENLVTGVLGKNASGYINYISTLFLFILFCNLSGLFGLRPPTAYYGVPLSLGLITFALVFIAKIKHQKVSGFIKGLCDPWWFWAPINIFGDIAFPIALSLRLFANILSGTVMLTLVYSMLPIFVKVGVPALVHVMFDLFPGAIQTYVFCMLTMTYIADAAQES